jgi:hypothetical protein
LLHGIERQGTGEFGMRCLHGRWKYSQIDHPRPGSLDEDQCAKIAVAGDENPAPVVSGAKQLKIFCLGHPQLGGCQHIVTQAAEEADGQGIYILIGEELHPVGFLSSAKLGGGEVNILGSQHIHCILDASAEIIGLEVGIIIAGNLIKAKPLPDQFQHALDSDARTRDAGFSEMNFRVDGNSISHEGSVADRAVRR